MIIIRNKLIPFGSFRAINLFCILFAKGDRELSESFLNHEEIHSTQIIELMILALLLTLPLIPVIWWAPLLSPLLFYAWYGMEYLIHFISYSITWTRKFIQGNFKKRKFVWKFAYRRISFEREAKGNEKRMDYLKNKGILSFLKYIG